MTARVGLTLAAAACACACAGARAGWPAAPPPHNTPDASHQPPRRLDPLGLGDGAPIALVGSVAEDGGPQPAQWDLSVKAIFVRRKQTAWVVGGWPITRVWGDRGTVTIVVLRDDRLWLAHAPPDQLAAARAAAAAGRLPEGAQPFLRWPPRAGDRLCPDPESPERCWVVEQAGDGRGDEVTVTYRTGPDDTSYVIDRVRGLVGFSYHHHGTPNDIELRRP